MQALNGVVALASRARQRPNPTQRLHVERPPVPSASRLVKGGSRRLWRATDRKLSHGSILGFDRTTGNGCNRASRGDGAAARERLVAAGAEIRREHGSPRAASNATLAGATGTLSVASGALELRSPGRRELSNRMAIPALRS
jgi:hypothetical protein